MMRSSQNVQPVTFAQMQKDVGQKLYEAEKIAMDDVVIMPLYTQCNAEMVSSKVEGIEFHPVALNRVYKDTVKK